MNVMNDWQDGRAKQMFIGLDRQLQSRRFTGPLPPDRWWKRWTRAIGHWLVRLGQ